MMECKDCVFYSKDDDNCTAFVCEPFNCGALPCEETDALTLYAMRGTEYEKNNRDFIDFITGGAGTSENGI